MNKKDFKKGWLSAIAWLCIAIAPISVEIVFIPGTSMNPLLKIGFLIIGLVWMTMCLYTDFGYMIVERILDNTVIEIEKDNRINDWIKRLDND